MNKLNDQDLVAIKGVLNSMEVTRERDAALDGLRELVAEWGYYAGTSTDVDGMVERLCDLHRALLGERDAARAEVEALRSVVRHMRAWTGHDNDQILSLSPENLRAAGLEDEARAVERAEEE